MKSRERQKEGKNFKHKKRRPVMVSKPILLRKKERKREYETFKNGRVGAKTPRCQSRLNAIRAAKDEQVGGRGKKTFRLESGRY